MLLVRFEELYFRKELNLAPAASRKYLTSQRFHLSEPLPGPRVVSKKLEQCGQSKVVLFFSRSGSAGARIGKNVDHWGL